MKKCGLNKNHLPASPHVKFDLIVHVVLCHVSWEKFSWLIIFLHSAFLILTISVRVCVCVCVCVVNIHVKRSVLACVVDGHYTNPVYLDNNNYLPLGSVQRVN